MISLAAQSVPAVCTTAKATHTSSSILDPIAKPIADVLAFFYSLIPNYAVAILLLSVVWMLIISPLTLKTTRSMLAMQKLAPELKRLQEKHRNDRQALTQAQMALYKEHNVSPFGSCLPTILPLPVFIALFRVIDGLSATTTVDGVRCANPHFLSHTTAMYQSILNAGGHLNAFGLDLAKSALSSHSSVAAALPFYVLLLIMMGTQYLQTAQMMSRNPAAQQNSQMAIMKYLPLVFGLICIRFPAGVVLYYAMSNVCRIVQQDLMYRFDPKVKTLAIKDVQEIEANAGVDDNGEARSMFSRRRDDGDAPAGRTRFRDLLGGEMQRQAQVREQAQANKALPKSGGSKPAKAPANKAGANRAAPGKASANRGTGAAGKTAGGKASAGKATANRPAKGGGPSKAGGASRSSGANRPAGQKVSGSPATPDGTSQSDRAAKAGNAPTQPAPERATNGNDDRNGEAGQQNRPSGSAPRTGAGSSRTGAGGGRTGGRESRNRRRGQ